MDWQLGLITIMIPFVVLLGMGMPVAFVFFFIMLLASIAMVGPEVGPYMTVSSLFSSIGIFSLAPVPLFVLMGEVLLHSGLAVRSLDALSRLVPRVPGRLAILSNLGGSLFGLLSGSTMASTAVLGSTLVPDMQRRGYSKAMSFGPVLASGGLAMIIPPSSLAIIYGTIAEISIGRLLIAGVIPGFIMAGFYLSQIILRVKLKPELAPAYEVEDIPFKEKVKLFAKEILPLGGIVFLVTGIFVIGIATPTEAAGMGAMGTVVMAAIYRRLPWKVLFRAVRGTVTITCMTLLIIGGSVIFSQMLSYSGITRAVVTFAVNADVSTYSILLIMIFLVLVLGTFMESVPIMMVVTPIFVPIAAQQNFDPIWFGIVMLITLQIGLTTPPFGLLLFVMKGVAPKGTTMPDLYRSAIPFLLCDITSLTLIIAFPALALWLPSVLFQ